MLTLIALTTISALLISTSSKIIGSLAPKNNEEMVKIGVRLS